MSPESAFQLAAAVLGLDILMVVLYLRRHRRLIDPF
jgi:hypothetical protein